MASRSPAVDVLADPVGWTGQPRWMPDWSVTERLLGLALFLESVKALAGLRNKPYPVYPDLPGLIPWAEFSGPISGELYWLADRGDPNEWPVVASGADGNWACRTFEDIPGGPSNTGR
ncbi:hypothetical protein ACFYOT_19730 [Saccharothrix saharensis]|uniref:hypothetical protein n=1 Tax=Saccharothrix saharensis TaxID=571190 RepID=UPI0036CDD017